jgi:LysM repeat protein
LTLVIVLILVVGGVAACTRSASTPVPSEGEGADVGTVDTQATMDAVRYAILTQTAQAEEGLGEEQATPTEAPPAVTATPEPEEAETEEAPDVTPPPTGEIEYTVQPGDWIWKIARDFGVDPQAIIDLNALTSPAQLEVGMVLKIPAPAEAEVEPTEPGEDEVSGTPPAAGTVHVVKAGEWIWSIARIYGVDPQDIIDANNLTDPATIYPGQELIIP